MLKLYNSMSCSKLKFNSIGKNKVKIFTCGPSIYRRPHIGNYKTFLYEDILVKYLEYCGYKVDRIIALTDIEDKSILEAKNTNKKIEHLTGNIAKIFFNESKLLKIKLPELIALSSTSIDQSVHLIKILLKSGHAYRHKGNIFFDPLKYKDFGKLFGLDMSKWPEKKVRFKKDTYNGKRWNMGDFILWHGCHDGDITVWDTEIGKGRPSWNIQDPAIITEHLGYKIDIICGGIDNIFRHHDYIIAIIESISNDNFAKYYLHGEHLVINGKTMSKSKGNIFYPEDMLNKTSKPYHLRFFLISTHYRQKLNLTERKYNECCEYIDTIRNTISRLLNKNNSNKKPDPEIIKIVNSIKGEFERNMDDDLKIGVAIDKIFPYLKKLEISNKEKKLSSRSIDKLENILKKIDSVAGVLF